MCHRPTLEEASKMENEAPARQEEATFTVDEGRVTFTPKFKCLGLLITQDLKDANDITRRVNQASVQVCKLTNAWRSKDVTTEFKKLAWTLNANNKRKLNTFHHKSICRMLDDINVFEAEAKKTTNVKLRETFDKIRNVAEFMQE
jgi:hypothetical protein